MSVPPRRGRQPLLAEDAALRGPKRRGGSLALIDEAVQHHSPSHRPGAGEQVPATHRERSAGATRRRLDGRSPGFCRHEAGYCHKGPPSTCSPRDLFELPSTRTGSGIVRGERWSGPRLPRAKGRQKWAALLLIVGAIATTSPCPTSGSLTNSSTWPVRPLVSRPDG